MSKAVRDGRGGWGTRSKPCILPLGMDGANPGAQLSLRAPPPLLKVEKQDYVSGDGVDAIAQACH